MAAGVVLLYRNGLDGPLLLDDLPNLNMLGQMPANPQWSDFWYHAWNGISGALGRPLALLTFLAQYQAWPDPFPFKLVNLLVHLVNGALVAVFCVLLGRACPHLRVTVVVVLVTVFVWLAHPLQVSTVLYVVQRMTELATMFILLGMCLYLEGRHRLETARHRSGVALLLAGTLGCGVLAVLSKETGVLLLVYLAVLEFTLLPAAVAGSAVYRWRVRLLSIPLATGVLVFFASLPVLLRGYALKPFDLTERVLTQFPVLLSYLSSFALLRPSALGIYHDDFPVASGLLHPWWTLPAALLVVGVMVVAISYRRRWPLLAFAVLWFLAGHALESTVLPLEMYFEHRNYLPLLGPVLALALATRRGLEVVPAKSWRLAVVPVVLLLGTMSLHTWQQSRRWGDPMLFATTAIRAHPASSRAQSNLMEAMVRAGAAEAAFAYHLRLVDPAQMRVAQYLRWLQFNCLQQDLPLPDAATLQRQARQSRHDYGALFQAMNLTMAIFEKRCEQAPREPLKIVLKGMLANPAYATSRADLYQLLALLAAEAGNFPEAAALAAASLEHHEDVLVALYRVSWLIAAGQLELADSELRLIEATHAGTIRQRSAVKQRVEELHYLLSGQGGL